jgi:hypothetical protein
LPHPLRSHPNRFGLADRQSRYAAKCDTQRRGINEARQGGRERLLAVSAAKRINRVSRFFAPLIDYLWFTDDLGPTSLTAERSWSHPCLEQNRVASIASIRTPL